MLKLSELKKALDSIGIPVAYHHFEDSHAYPYIVYEEVSKTGVYADGINFVTYSGVQVELYTATKDPTLERKVANIFETLELPFTASETVVESENCFAVSFYLEIFLEDEEE